jgi:hypothetical protein
MTLPHPHGGTKCRDAVPPPYVFRIHAKVLQFRVRPELQNPFKERLQRIFITQISGPEMPYKLILNGFVDLPGRSTPDAFVALERIWIEDAASVDHERAAA